MIGSGLRVWGIGTSRTIRVHWALEELGLEYETREILPRTESMRSPDFVRLSARGKIPLLEDGELVIGESGAILFHLAERYRDCIELAPESNSRARAAFDDLCFFILTELDAVLYIIRRHEGLPEIYGSAPVATQAARDYFLRQVGEPERRLEDGRRHLLGENFSAADILLSSCLSWAQFVGIELGEVLASYQRRVTERDAYRRAAERNFTPEALKLLKPPDPLPTETPG